MASIPPPFPTKVPPPIDAMDERQQNGLAAANPNGDLTIQQSQLAEETTVSVSAANGNVRPPKVQSGTPNRTTGPLKSFLVRHPFTEVFGLESGAAAPDTPVFDAASVPATAPLAHRMSSASFDTEEVMSSATASSTTSSQSSQTVLFPAASRGSMEINGATAALADMSVDASQPTLLVTFLTAHDGTLRIIDDPPVPLPIRAITERPVTRSQSILSGILGHDRHGTGRARSSSVDTAKRDRKKNEHRKVHSLLSPSKLFDFLVVVSLVVEERVSAPPVSTATTTAGNKKTPPQPIQLVKRALVPRITYRYPPSPDSDASETNLLATIPQFCFPEWQSGDNGDFETVEDFVLDDRYTPSSRANILQSETFSFVLTNLNGEKRFGYCRRLLSDVEVEGEIPVRVPAAPGTSTKGMEVKAGLPITTTYIRKRKRLPEVYCIISPAGCFSLFSQVLDIVEKRRALDTSKSSLYAFLQAVIAQPFPKPGRSITVKTFPLASDNTKSAEPEEYQLHRPVEFMSFEHVSFLQLFQSIGINSVASLSATTPNSPFSTLVTLISALMLERRIIFVSRSLQKLSDCCNAAVALLYPLEWQHVFIPILPRRLLEFVSSPTPFVIGVLASDAGRIVPPHTDLSLWGTEGVKVHERSKTLPGKRSTQKAAMANFFANEQADVLPIDDALVINVDTGVIMRHDTATQDRQFMPIYLMARLKLFLEDAMRSAPELFDPSQQPASPDATVRQRQNAALADALLRFFVLILGPYREYMEVDMVNNGSPRQTEPSMSRTTSPIDKPLPPRPESPATIHSDTMDAEPDRIRVQFDHKAFTEQHALISGDGLHVWMPDSDQSIAPTASQRQSIQAFLESLRLSHNFQYFIQQREEAFQYHYQMQYEKSIGRKRERPADKVDLPAGLKYYYALSQSRFEKRVTWLEMKNQRRFLDKQAGA